MDCERCNMMLSAFADHALTGHELARVRTHLATCRRCREDLNEIETVRNLLRALPQPEPSQDFWANAHRTLRRHAASHRRWPFMLHGLRPGWTAVTAVMLALAFIGTPKRLGHVATPTKTVDLSALVSLHAISAVGSPTGDIGSLRYTITEANSRDWANDHALDVQ